MSPFVVVVTLTFGVIALTTIPDEALITINSLEILGIIYLAVAVSKLRERIAKIEGRAERDRGDG